MKFGTGVQLDMPNKVMQNRRKQKKNDMLPVAMTTNFPAKF